MNTKKVLLSSMSVLLAAAVISACGGEKKETSTDGPKTFTYWIGMAPTAMTYIQSYNEMDIYKQREKDSGVHIEFIHPASGQAQEQFNLMVASRDMADIIEYDWPSYQGGTQKAIDDNVIIALNDYLDNAPNFKEMVNSKDAFRRGSRTLDGNYFGFTGLPKEAYEHEYITFGGPSIRRDWLKELGLEMPETIDEWTNVLTQFKDKKNASAPITGSGDMMSNFIGAFDIGYRWYADEGKICFGPMQEKYADFLKLMNKWYNDGLLDKEYPSNKGNLIDAKITKGNSGALMTVYINGGMGRYLQVRDNENPDYDLAAAPYPVLNKGEMNRFGIGSNSISLSYVACISANCKDIPGVMEWFDYWYTDEGYLLMNYGIEGDTYNMVDGIPTYTDKIAKNPDGLSMVEAQSTYLRTHTTHAGIGRPADDTPRYYPYPQQTEALGVWLPESEERNKTNIPQIMTSAEVAEELAVIETDLNSYVEEMEWKFISGEEPIEKLPEFREMLKNNFRVERYEELMQEQYDKFMSL